MSQQDQDNPTPTQPADTPAEPQADALPQPVPPPREPQSWDRPPRNPEEEAFEDDFVLGEGAREPTEPPNDFDALEPGPTEVVSFASSSRGRNGRGRDAEPREDVDEPPLSPKGFVAFLADPEGPLLRHKGVAIAVAAGIVVLAIILVCILSSSKSPAPGGAAPTPEWRVESSAAGQTHAHGAPGR